MDNNYLAAFYFELVYEGEKIAFQEITGIAAELNVEEVSAGGENRFTYKLPKSSAFQNLICKRAITARASKLTDWCNRSINYGLVNKIETSDVSLNLLDANGLVARSWTFHNAYPIKYSISELNSMENALVIETIELAYTYFEISATTVKI